jgi:membrane protease YdiL (CAAX protease family)
MPMRWLAQFLEHTLILPVERDHRQPDHMFRRRRIVVAVTLVVGAALLALSLATEPGNPDFYALTFALAGAWVAGALLSGPLHAGRMRFRTRQARPIVQPFLIGLAAVAVFTAGAWVVAQVPFLSASADRVLDHARHGSLPLIAVVAVVNGLAEELFFRGALYAAVGGRRPVLVSTVVYTLTTVVTGNAMLVFSAAVLGLLVGLERRVSGGVMAPMITHVTWSLGMLLILPPLMATLTT